MQTTSRYIQGNVPALPRARPLPPREQNTQSAYHICTIWLFACQSPREVQTPHGGEPEPDEDPPRLTHHLRACLSPFSENIFLGFISSWNCPRETRSACFSHDRSDVKIWVMHLNSDEEQSVSECPTPQTDLSVSPKFCRTSSSHLPVRIGVTRYLSLLALL